MSELPPLPPEVEELLRRSPRPEVPSGFDRTVLERIRSTLKVELPTSKPSTPSPSSTPSVSSAATQLPRLSPFGTWGVPLSLFALGTGATVGVVVGRHMPIREPTPVEIVVPQPSPPRPEIVASAPAPTTVPAPNPIESAPTPNAAPVSAPTVVPSTTATPRPKTITVPKSQVKAPTPPETIAQGSSRDLDLAAERTLVEMARTALDKNQLEDVSRALQAHEKRFPQGQFTEDREVLWIELLVRRNDRSAARERAARFHQEFPESISGPAVDAAVNAASPLDAGDL
jgi:hypothetical protein